jgi:hypothetical protein
VDRQAWDITAREQRIVRRYEEPSCLICSLRRQQEQNRQMRERSGPQYDLSVERSRIMNRAWRAAGSPQDPRRQWSKALQQVTSQIPDSERFNVYIGHDRIGENLTISEASAMIDRASRAEEYRGRGIPETWPARAEPRPADPDERWPRRLAWLRSLGLTQAEPGEDTPERRAWEAWLRERARLRRELGWGR